MTRHRPATHGAAMPYPNGSQWHCDKCGKGCSSRSAAVACEDQDKAQEEDLRKAREGEQP